MRRTPASPRREPRQGAPALVAGQAEIRLEVSLGRPHDPCRQCHGLESMGFKTFGFGGGRADVWEPDESRLLGQGGHLARRRALHGRGGNRRFTSTPIGSISKALSTASRRLPEPLSRNLHPTTRRAISRRSCSACRSRSPSIRTSRSRSCCASALRSKPRSTPSSKTWLSQQRRSSSRVTER